MASPNNPPVRKRARLPVPVEGVAPEPASLPLCNPVQIEFRPIGEMQGSSRKVRRRKAEDIQRHADCIERNQFDPPIVVDENGRVVCGDDHLVAYRLLKRAEVPVIVLSGHSEAELAAITLWLEGFHASGEWADDVLKETFEFILDQQPDLLAASFWTLSDIDLALHKDAPKAKTETQRAAEQDAEPAVTHTGDIFVRPQGHRLICGNSRLPGTYVALLKGRQARILAGDPPYGVAVADISTRHDEWQEGSGMTEPEAAKFFEEFLGAATPHLTNGALVYLFIDAKGMYPLLGAVRTAGLQQKTLCTWDKIGPGLGSFYRNQSEHVVVAKHGKAKHVFNAKCDFNTTIWSAPGYAQFRPDRKAALEAHPCTKPQSILMGILLAGSNIGDLCLDPFNGSGSQMLAAERTKRVCYGVEIDGRFIDTTVYRMKALTGDWPIHEETGLTFEALAAQRGVELTAPPVFDPGDL